MVFPSYGNELIIKGPKRKSVKRKQILSTSVRGYGYPMIE